MIEIETDQIPGLEGTDESVKDDPLFTPLLDRALEICGRAHPTLQVLGNGGYDQIHLFNTIEKRGI